MSLERRQERAAGGAWILEQLSLAKPDHERNAARRAMKEVVRAWPGDTRRLWWKWFSEASSSLGLRSKTLDCSIDEVVDLADQGVQVVTYTDSPEPQWLGILGAKKKKLAVILASEDSESHWTSRRQLRKWLSRFAVDGTVRCVLVQPHDSTLTLAKPQKSVPPLERLKQLLRPEWSDVWLVLIFAFVVGLLALATPIAVESLVNTVAFGRFLQPIVILALILLTFLGFAAAVRALQSYVVEIIQRRLFARIAADLAYRLPRVEVEAVDGRYLPEQVNRFFDVVTVQKVTAQLLLDGVALILSTFIGMAVLGFYHPWLLGFDVLLLAAIAFVILALGRGAVASAIRESKNKYTMAAWLEDIARCPVSFRNDGGTKFAMERADRFVHEYLTARRSHFTILFRQIVFALGLQAVASTVLLGLGGWLVVSGELTLGQLVAAELIVTTIVGAFAKFGKHIESFYDLLASVDKLGSLTDLPTEREDGIVSATASHPAELLLDGVSYAFPKRGRVLSQVSATARPGTSLAIYGGSGSGKSVLLDLVYGTRTPSAGHLMIDGYDPRDLRPDGLRNHVALVRDEVFAATIEDNVHLHREDVSAGDVRDLLHSLGLLDVVVRLKSGLQTRLAANGSPLTENQRKLLSLARAMAGGPGLLLIDGILDGLPDDDLERVVNCLFAEPGRWTIVVGTGRHDIAARCDSMLQLKATQAAG